MINFWHFSWSALSLVHFYESNISRRGPWHKLRSFVKYSQVCCETMLLFAWFDEMTLDDKGWGIHDNDTMSWQICVATQQHLFKSTAGYWLGAPHLTILNLTYLTKTHNTHKKTFIITQHTLLNQRVRAASESSLNWGGFREIKWFKTF